MNKVVYIVVFTLLLSACSKNEIVDVVDKTPDNTTEIFRINKTFKASSSNDDSRLIMQGTNLTWVTDDKINVFAFKSSSLADNRQFTLSEGAGTTMGTFQGTIVGDADYYYSLYPYSSSVSLSGNNLININLPRVQTYVENGVDEHLYPIFGKEESGVIKYKALCGVLKINLLGTSKIKKILFQGNNLEGISGTMKIDLTKEEPILEHHLLYGFTIELDCGEGVTLNTSTSTAFNIVLPCMTFTNGFTIKIIDDNGEGMAKTANKSITIERRVIKPMSAFTYEPESINLNDEINSGTDTYSNCYVVTQPNLKYNFDVTHKGNSSESSLTPSTVEVLWESGNVVGNVIKDVHFTNTEKTRVGFTTSSEVAGNAVIAVKDAEGSILWSWHIWSNNSLLHGTYETNVDNHVYTVLNHAVGVISNDEANRESFGLYYQWGRKDPFVGPKTFVANPSATAAAQGGSYWLPTTTGIGGKRIFKDDIPSSETSTIEYSIKNPTTYIYTKTSTNSNGTRNDYDWVRSTEEEDLTLWDNQKKTIYDPCPLGYRVTPYDTYTGLIKTASYNGIKEYNITNDASSQCNNVLGHNLSSGILFEINEVINEFFPYMGRLDYMGAGNIVRINDNSSGRYWIAKSHSTSGCAECTYYKNKTETSAIFQPTSVAGGKKVTASPVRCIKE